MKRFLYLMVLFLSLFLPKVTFATDFIDGFEDVPLMQGLKQQENQNFSFGNEESGYTEALLYPVKKMTFEDVGLFYIDVLPKFGWLLLSQKTNYISFIRDNDILEISPRSVRPLRISISIKSKN